MLNILFKECCKECPHIDAEINSDMGRNVLSKASLQTYIYCSHYHVCKMYKEQSEDKNLVKS